MLKGKILLSSAKVKVKLPPKPFTVTFARTEQADDFGLGVRQRTYGWIQHVQGSINKVPYWIINGERIVLKSLSRVDTEGFDYETQQGTGFFEPGSTYAEFDSAAFPNEGFTFTTNRNESGTIRNSGGKTHTVYGLYVGRTSEPCTISIDPPPTGFV